MEGYATRVLKNEAEKHTARALSGIAGHELDGLRELYEHADTQGSGTTDNKSGRGGGWGGGRAEGADEKDRARILHIPVFCHV
jgi:hypothetical protein